jgi:hypothetical protein
MAVVAVIGWLLVLVGGTGAGLLASWHQAHGGAGAPGWVVPAMALGLLTVGFVLGAAGRLK